MDLFVILVISHFGLEEKNVVLVIPIPNYCLPLLFFYFLF